MLKSDCISLSKICIHMRHFSNVNSKIATLNVMSYTEVCLKFLFYRVDAWCHLVIPTFQAMNLNVRTPWQEYSSLS